MNVLRGSGTNGLRGIEAKQGKYIRPLIEISRTEIEEFCEQEKLEPRIDESNFENEFTRNKIRNIVIPYIKKEFNPNIIDTLERLAEITREQEDFINAEAKNKYNKILIQEINLPNFEYNRNEYNSEIILNLKEFNKLPIVIQKKVLLISIQKIFGSTKGIEKIHLEDMIKLCNRNIGNKYLTPNKNLKIVIKNKQIHISSINTSIPSNH
jgi:tRNA(Ile)-lysidine synthase